jgi:hypothetical protein
MNKNHLIVTVSTTMIGCIMTMLPPVRRLQDRFWKRLIRTLENAALKRKT